MEQEKNEEQQDNMLEALLKNPIYIDNEQDMFMLGVKIGQKNV